MLVKLYNNTPAKRVRVESQGDQYVGRVEFADGRVATLIFSIAFGYSLCFDKGGFDTKFVHVASDLFAGLVADMIHFYKTGETSFDTAQTLTVMKLREAMIKGKNNLGAWIEV